MPTSDRPPRSTGPRRSRNQQGGVVRFLVAAVSLLMVAAAVGVMAYRGDGPFPDPEGCRADVGGVTVELDLEQAENAALIAAIGVRRGLPARAVSIALATAYQESKIRNLDHGDRDSLGLFQQRPSMGWGTAEQVQNPRYATNRFYDELVKVDGYRDMRITDAAQTVQRSGFPEAYEDHAEDGRALASALTGYSRAAFSCQVRRDDGVPAEAVGRTGLTPRAEAVRRDVERAFGDLALGGFARGGVDSGHMPGSAHYDGRAVDIFFRPVSEDNQRRGWAVAHYLVAQAERLHIQHVIFDGRIWSVGRLSGAGWRDYDPPSRSGDPDVLEHRDHVHVDVIEGS